MGMLTRFADFLRRRKDARTGFAYSSSWGTEWGTDWGSFIQGMSVAKLYSTQPDLQAVVSFRAREMASLPIHVYRISDAGSVHRKVDGPLRDLFVKPNSHQTGYELIRDTVSSIDLYGSAYWYCFPSIDSPTGFCIEPIHPTWIVGSHGGNIYKPDAYVVRTPDGRSKIVLKGENIVRFSSYAPDGINPVCPIESLKGDS